MNDKNGLLIPATPIGIYDTLKVCRVRDVKLPEKAHRIDAGFDFFIPNDFKEQYLFYNNDILIPSGIKVIVPHGYALIAMNKSGVALKHKLQIGACVVDEGYTGEVHIHIYNFSHPNNAVKLVPGMKLVQFVLVRIGNHVIHEISSKDYEAITSAYERGDGAFGSTGA